MTSADLWREATSLTQRLSVLARYTLRRTPKGYCRKTFRTNCPERPGVYVMSDEYGAPVYVGRSRNLRRRLATYLRAQDPADKAQRILASAASVRWEVLPDEFGARLREVELIQAWRPRYNVQFHPLRKRRSYLYLTCEDAPRFVAAATTPAEADCLAVVGPLPSLRRLNAVSEILNDLYKLRSCTDQTLARALKAKRDSAACHRHAMKSCIGPCLAVHARDAYAAQVAAARGFLSGRDKSLPQVLAVRMQALAENLAFEQATLVRDQLELLGWVMRRMRQIRKMRRSYHFIYPVGGGGGLEHWYLVRGGQVIDVMPAPDFADGSALAIAERASLCERIEAHYFRAEALQAQDPGQPDSPWADSLAGYNLTLVAQWFRERPEELDKVIAPEEALARLGKVRIGTVRKVPRRKTRAVPRDV